MSTRNVVLTDHQDRLIEDLIAAGRYQNASEVLRAGLRLLESEEVALRSLKARLEKSIAQAERGEFAEGTPDQIFNRAFKNAKARQTSG